MANEYKLEVLVGLISTWMQERGITQNGVPIGQAIKTLEETTELLSALNVNDDIEVKDAIGDIFVTLIGVCETYGTTLEECVNNAYDEIKDRKGHLRSDGVFVKD